jgi:methylphosphotriester-DNA--protein-cysteine methyltransferase
MQYREIHPSRRLARFVKCFWTLEAGISPGDDSAPEPVMPDGCIELIFNLANPFTRYHADGTLERQPRSIIAGQMRSSAMIEPSGRIDLFGVRFQYAGASPFFRFPLSELTDSIVDLGFVWGSEGGEIEARIHEAPTAEMRAGIVENGLLRLLAKNTAADGVVEAASKLIVENMGLASIDKISDSMGVNGRRLERRFQQSLGLSPKRFSRIIRFQNFLGAVRNDPSNGILDAALSFGYYDQAHLIREFREFSGKTPLAFFENEHKLSEVFITA